MRDALLILGITSMVASGCDSGASGHRSAPDLSLTVSCPDRDFAAVCLRVIRLDMYPECNTADVRACQCGHQPYCCEWRDPTACPPDFTCLSEALSCPDLGGEIPDLGLPDMPGAADMDRRP